LGAAAQELRKQTSFFTQPYLPEQIAAQFTGTKSGLL
jgi:hypothetical protein